MQHRSVRLLLVVVVGLLTACGVSKKEFNEYKVHVSTNADSLIRWAASTDTTVRALRTWYLTACKNPDGTPCSDPVPPPPPPPRTTW